MPSDAGRSWDRLARHWRELWSPHPSEEARAALRSYLEALGRNVSQHHRAIESVRQEVRTRGAPPPPVKAPHAPAKAAPHAPAKAPHILVKPPHVPSRPAHPEAPHVGGVLDAKLRAKLEQHLGYRFRDPHLLDEALAHQSFATENPEVDLQSNYRLAFLGDAILSFLVADALHARFPKLGPEDLTPMRARLVERESLAKTAARVGLGPCLFLGRGMEVEGRRSTNVLSEAFEALVAAVYADAGLEETRDVFLRVLEPEFQRIHPSHAPRPRAVPSPRAGRRRRRP